MIYELTVGDLYSNDEIFRALGLANAGGIRIRTLNNAVERAAIMTSEQGLHGKYENPYHDRRENDILIYTAEGKIGEQSLSGRNSRLMNQKTESFPIHGFALVANRRDKTVGPKRWAYLGLLQYVRHYADKQLGSDGKVRKVWLFEFRIHAEPQLVTLADDAAIWQKVRLSAEAQDPETDDSEIVTAINVDRGPGEAQIESVRSQLLSLDPRRFEFIVRELLEHSGFADVCVTRFTSDGGVDVNARAGAGLWVFKNALVQVQAKRWLHSVGRREVAELRGSLEPFAHGAVVTTSYFSRAAVTEACAPGKNPIVLVDGCSLAKAVIEQRMAITS